MSHDNKLKQLRKKKGINQDILAEVLNVSVPMYCQLERGTRNLTVQMGAILADYYNCTIEELL